jgi:arylsulfatase A-like enzyme
MTPPGKAWPKNTFKRDGEHVTDAINALAIDWMKQKRDPSRPFYLMYHHKAPHDNFEFAPRYANFLQDVEVPEPESLWRQPKFGSLATRGADDELLPYIGTSVGGRNLRRNYEKFFGGEPGAIAPLLGAEQRKRWAYNEYLKRYLRCVKGVDDSLATFFDYLRTAGLMDNTIIIWIGDNGRCQVRGKGYLFEDGIKCPLIISGKGIESGKVLDDLVSGIDLTATILALAGIEKPAQMQGQAFLAHPDYQPNDHVFCARDRWDEITDCSRAIVGPRYKYIYNFMPEVPYDAGQNYLDKENVRPILPQLREMHKAGKLTPAQAYFMQPKKELEQLYDLQQDPWELNNLANSAEHKATKETMRSRLFKWIESTGDRGLKKASDGSWKPDPDKISMKRQ